MVFRLQLRAEREILLRCAFFAALDRSFLIVLGNVNLIISDNFYKYRFQQKVFFPWKTIVLYLKGFSQPAYLRIFYFSWRQLFAVMLLY